MYSIPKIKAHNEQMTKIYAQQIQETVSYVSRQQILLLQFHILIGKLKKQLHLTSRIT